MTVTIIHIIAFRSTLVPEKRVICTNKIIDDFSSIQVIYCLIYGAKLLLIYKQVTLTHFLVFSPRTDRIKIVFTALFILVLDTLVDLQIDRP